MDVRPDLLPSIEEVAREAGALLRQYFRRPMEVAYKGVANPVTEADTASEELIRTRLARLLPEADFLGEETGGSLAGPRPLWVVDPLDGTTNFSHGLPWFCVSIALVIDCAPHLGVIYHPLSDECYTGRLNHGAFCNGRPLAVSRIASLGEALLSTGFYYHKGAELTRQISVFERVHQHVQAIRRPGSAALDLAYVAAGYFDAFWEQGLAPWDVAAGYLLVREAGGRVTDYQGREASLDGRETLASNGCLHERLIALLNGG